MRLLYIADGRSPIAHNWIKYFVESPHEVHLISTYPTDPPFKLTSFSTVPVAFSGIARNSIRDPGTRSGDRDRNKYARFARKILTVGTRTLVRQWLGPYTVQSAARRLKELIVSIRPDVVHAMRIPFEGMISAISLQDIAEIPLLISVWGNDFTLHATSNRKMSNYTRITMERANALHTDTFRDQILAREWGFDPQNPMIVQPCGGGVDMEIFYPPSDLNGNRQIKIINPRGMRAYVRNDTFFRAIPIVKKEFPEIRFLCPAMAGEGEAENWLKALNIEDVVELLPHQNNREMAELFRQSQITVSITTHDGTPNSLIEALACGCFPIAGDIESLHEWISPKENGILVDPGNPLELAEAMLTAIEDNDLRLKAHKKNMELVKVRAEYRHRMAETHEFYKSISV